MYCCQGNAELHSREHKKWQEKQFNNKSGFSLFSTVNNVKQNSGIGGGGGGGSGSGGGSGVGWGGGGRGSGA